jgi:hypothetical protein
MVLFGVECVEATGSMRCQNGEIFLIDSAAGFGKHYCMAQIANAANGDQVHTHSGADGYIRNGNAW